MDGRANAVDISQRVKAHRPTNNINNPSTRREMKDATIATITESVWKKKDI